MHIYMRVLAHIFIYVPECVRNIVYARKPLVHFMLNFVFNSSFDDPYFFVIISVQGLVNMNRKYTFLYISVTFISPEK